MNILITIGSFIGIILVCILVGMFFQSQFWECIQECRLKTKKYKQRIKTIKMFESMGIKSTDLDQLSIRYKFPYDAYSARTLHDTVTYLMEEVQELKDSKQDKRKKRATK